MPRRSSSRSAPFPALTVCRLLALAAWVLLATGCAQLPQSSVTLSSSIGDDIASMQKAHKQMINYYYDGLQQQANALVDDKYRPSLIRQVIEQDVAKFRNPAVQSESLFNAIQIAFVNNTTMSAADLDQAQSNAMAGMKIFYTKIDARVEVERKKLLDPLQQQRQSLLAAIDTNYSNIMKKNGVVTTMLQSVVDVHETQQELLTAAGVKEDVRVEVGSRLAELSDTVAEIQGKVDAKTSQASEVEAAINQFRQAISK